ncbi:MAG: hypothetical protein JO060_05450 [Candidatus Eremiobacteraeota bacterium]|nr:hypothetical protein [Candidatus Eremiobacteraeota bacterium]MBV9648065.1 hypothetical protein [Candidatus Eremiobacteraeota bacterium]
MAGTALPRANAVEVMNYLGKMKFVRFVACIAGLALGWAVADAKSAGVVFAMKAPTWMKITTRDRPSRRAAFAMAYDPVSKKVVLFGGYSGSSYLADTWTFDGASWQLQHPSTSPAGRSASSMAFDKRTKKLVLFGGYDGVSDRSDTWLWDGSTGQWSATDSKKSPGALTGPNLFTDPLDGHVDEFGGYDGFLYQLRTWRWDGNTWELLHKTHPPSARAFAEVATNPVTRTTLLFGGLADINSANTWTWDGTRWREQSPSMQPPGVYYGAAAYDRALDAVVTFGGGHGGVDLNDTWAWSGANWMDLTPTNSPSPRESHGMAFDAAIGHIVLFGGTYYPKHALYNDTWELIP